MVEKFWCLAILKFKKIIGYLYHDHKVKPLHMILPKASGYVESYEEQTKWMYFLNWQWWVIRKIILFEIK